ncbi:PrsW family intramembrane metalloprotease, partial [bacterium]|nr:PrsW family intramembrane metalloprotease [bacterium]
FHSPDLDEPIDPLVYLITVALGFAALENTLFIMGTIQTGDIAQTIITGNMRFIGATLLHVLASSCVGIMLGFVFYRSHITRFLAGLVGLCAGIALHAYFNLSIISTSTVGALKIFGTIWIGVVLLFMAFEEIKGVQPSKSSQQST